MKKVLSVFFLFWMNWAFGQDTLTTAVPEEVNDKVWAVEASVYYYSLPYDNDFFLPIFYADLNSIHFEARYNYEDRETFSVFAGYRFETGKDVIIGITPMAGLVMGNTKGVAPGVLIDVAYKNFDFYSESEYVIDYESFENNFFYTWSEAAISPTENIRTGLSANRTKVFESDREVQHGVFFEYSLSNFTLGAHYFNPLTEDYFIIGMINYQF